MPRLLPNVMLSCMNNTASTKPVDPVKEMTYRQAKARLSNDLITNDYPNAEITYKSSNMYKLDKDDNLDNIEDWNIFIDTIQIANLYDIKKFMWFFRTVVSDYDRYMYYRNRGFTSYFKKEHERADSLKRYCYYKTLVNRIHAKLLTFDKHPKINEMISYLEHTGMIKNRYLT